MNILSIATFAIAMIEMNLVLVILFRNKEHSPTVQFFALLTAVISLWTAVNAIIPFLEPGQPNLFLSVSSFFGVSEAHHLVSVLFQLSFFLVNSISILFFCFAYVSTNNTPLPLRVSLSTTALLAALIPFYLSGMIVHGSSHSISGLGNWTWSYGPLWVLFDISFTLFMLWGLFLLYKKSLFLEGSPLKNMRYLLLSMFTVMVPVTFATMVLPHFDMWEYVWFGPFIGACWVSLLSLSVIRSTNASSRSVLAQTLALTVGVVLGLNILVSGITKGFSAAFEAIVKTFVFGAFMTVGRLLVANIFKETERKGQVEDLNLQLRALHEDLEGKVVERTKELAEAKFHSETILENLTPGVIEYDEHFTILRVNRAAEKLLGVERQRILGNIIQPKDKDIFELSSLATVLYPALSEESKKVSPKEEFEKDIAKNEITIVYPEKRELQVMTVTLKGLYASETPRFVKLLRDVTHENMVDRSKSEFIKIAAHQLRTPLSGTKWALRTTLDKDLGETSPEQEQLLQRIYDSNNGLIEVVNDLLNIARIEEDFGYHKEENDLVEVIKEAVVSSLLLKKDKNLDITFKKTLNDVPRFNFDKVKILIVVKNIVTNAIDYTPNNGTITITLKQEGGFAVITVEDAGIGIPEESIRHIFSKFYRSKEARESLPYRSGLGLYIAKDIVEKHGGDISIESSREPGRSGTKVTVGIPLSL